MALSNIHIRAMLALSRKDYQAARAEAEKIYALKPLSTRWNRDPSSFLLGVILVKVTRKDEREAYFNACMTLLDCYEVSTIYGDLEENIRSIAIAAQGAIEADAAGWPVLRTEDRKRVATLALAFAALAFGPERPAWARAALGATRKYGVTYVKFWGQTDATARMLAAGAAAAGDWREASAGYERVVSASSGTLGKASELGARDQLEGIWNVMAGATTVEGEAGSVLLQRGENARGVDLLERSRRPTLGYRRSGAPALSGSVLEASLLRSGAVVVQPICSWAGTFATASVIRDGKLERSTSFEPKHNSYELFFRLISTQARFLIDRNGLLPSYQKARKAGGKKQTPALKAYVERAAVAAEDFAASVIRSSLMKLKTGRQDDVVVVVPGSLALLPIGLGRVTPTGLRLMEQFQLRFVDSLQTAVRVADNRQSQDRSTVFLSSEVRPADLRFLDFEAATTGPSDGAAKRRIEAGAGSPGPLGELDGNSYWHIASHGAWDFANPDRSGLALNKKRATTIDDILKLSPRSPPRLVYLSACETGFVDVKRNLSDFSGLPSAFLAAGAIGVVGALWAVNDASSALIAARFYDLHFGERRSPADALRNAQLWLSKATAEDLYEYVASKASASGASPADFAEMLGHLADRAPAEVPFAHPYYWGGFQLYGL